MQLDETLGPRPLMSSWSRRFPAVAMGRSGTYDGRREGLYGFDVLSDGLVEWVARVQADVDVASELEVNLGVVSRRAFAEGLRRATRKAVSLWGHFVPLSSHHSLPTHQDDLVHTTEE